ncbi:MAG: hypothetical protein ACP5NW_03560 [Candidatus Woesearchaeota archaeon]
MAKPQPLFVRRIYLMDTKFLDEKGKDTTIQNPNTNSHTLEDYAAEIAYRVIGDIMEEHRTHPEKWNAKILRDNTPESLQITYRIMAHMPHKGSFDTMYTAPKDVNEWYSINSRASNSLIILANAPTLNDMGYQMIGRKMFGPENSSDKALVDNDNNYYFNLSTHKMERIPKFSYGNQQEKRYKDLASKLWFG